MFRINPHFEQVSDQTVLWRYMPLTRLQSILQQRSIFFTKVTTYDDDPFEGSYNKISEEHYIQWMLSDMPGETILSVSEEIRQNIYQKVSSSLSLSKAFKELVLVNCWHINNYESVAMWKLYSSYENGIAIRTTYGRLKQSLENFGRPIYGGKIRYIDIKKDRISFGNTLAPFAAKRISFTHENELRLVTLVDHDRHFHYDWSKEDFDNGQLIPCNVELLIDSIFVSPKSSEDFRLQVQQLTDEHHLQIEVARSDIENIY